MAAPPEDDLACREFVELVTDYLDGALPEAEHRRFEAHLAECEGCARYLDQVQSTIRTVGATAGPPLDPHARAALLRAFRELRAQP